MGLNVSNKDTWWFVSDYNMMLCKDVWGGTELRNLGAGDSIQRTYEAYVTYRWPGFIDAIRSCWKKDGKKYKPQRYPVAYDGMPGMSRDHVIYSILAFQLAVEDGLMTRDEMIAYIDGCPFIIGDNLGTMMTLKLWAWMKLMAGRKIGCIYYPISTLSSGWNLLWNKFVNIFSGINYGKEDNQNVFRPIFPEQKSKLTNFFVSLYYPTYAVKLSVHMLMAVRSNWIADIHSRILRKMRPDKNDLLLSILIWGHILPPPYSYKSMTCDRWSAQLNALYNDRPIYIVEDKFGPQYVVENDFDRDYLLSQT